MDEVPQFIPLTPEYREYWTEQKRLVLQGVWQSGYWIPGTLHYYINHWTIEIKKHPDDKVSDLLPPFFRDVEYEIHMQYQVARGFSRFSEQTKEDIKGLTPYDILTKGWNYPQGYPLYENEAKSIMLVTGRGLGKSFNFACLIDYEWRFLEHVKQKKQVVVGAHDTKYSDDLLNKVKLGQQHLKGGITFNDKYYPPPFFKRYKGGWASGKTIEAKYDIMRGRSRIPKGDGSIIKHVCFRNNIQAAGGTRANLIVLEEAGIFPNLARSFGACRQGVKYDNKQFGTIVAMGTGGDMESGTVDLSSMFYSVDSYNLISIDDKWEYKGKIGLFFPASMAINNLKDTNGNTVYPTAYDYVMSRREELLNDDADRIAIEQETMFNPEKPTEAFLISSGNIFPKIQLQDHLSNIETHDSLSKMGQVGELDFNEDGTLKWTINNKLKPVTNFPIKDHQDVTGAIIIYEHPYLSMEGLVPYNLYVGGTDPLDHSKAEFSESLLSTYIFKRFNTFEDTYDTIVAEYVGRPDMIEEAYENTRKLLIYYNAMCLYENNLPGMFTYFKNKRSLHMLYDTPDIIRQILKDSKVDRGKGVHMVEKLKTECENFTNSWLRTDYAPGKMNLEKIPSVGLLKELIQYNKKGNFDRCFDGNTMITTDYGFKKISDIVVGEKVLTHTGNYKQVTHWSKHKPEDSELLNIKVCSIFEDLLVTKNHKIFAMKIKRVGQRESYKNKIIKRGGSWHEARDLKKNDMVLIPKRKALPKNNFEDDMLYLFGWYLADGHIGKNKAKNKITICLQGDQKHIAIRLMEIIAKYTTNEPKSNSVDGTKKYKPVKLLEYPYGKNCYFIEVSSYILASLFTKNCGTAHNKTINKELYNTSNLMPLVIGFLEGDGHQKLDKYGRNIIECSSIYKDLIKQIRQILLDNGIYNSVCIKAPRKLSNKSQICISISGKYVLPIVQASLKFNITTINTYTKNFGVETNDGYFIPIKSITPVKFDDYVYNFSVKDDETYVASGVVVHNCISFFLIMLAIQNLHEITIKKQEDTVRLDEFFPKRINVKTSKNTSFY